MTDKEKLTAIEKIAREAFSNPVTSNINLYRAQKLADIFAIFQYDGLTLSAATQTDSQFAGQIDISEVLNDA